MRNRLKRRTSGTGVRAGIVAAIVATLAALAIIPAQASGGGPDIVQSEQGPGFVFDPTESTPPIPLLRGLADPGATRVTVALKDKATGKWWQPDDVCATSIFPTCSSGVLGQKWEKNDALLSEALPGEDIVYRFRLLPPDGTYMVGIKAYDEYGNSGRSIWQELRFETTQQSFSADLAPPLPANTYKEGSGFALEGGRQSSGDTGFVAIYNRDLARWVDPSGNALSAWQRFPAQGTGDDFFGFRWAIDLDLPAGRYAYGADVIDENGVRVDGTPWTYFTVQPCSVRCANVSLTSATVDFDDNGGACFGVTSTGRVELALRNDDTGQWLQTADPVVFGQSWTQFNNLTTILQAGPDARYSCYNDPGIDLPSGNYHLGVKTYDGDGDQGPKAWFAFSVR